MINIIKAHMNDLEHISDIYAHARRFMRENGNPNQWKDVHPPKESLIENIKEQKLYLLKEGGNIDAVFFFDKGPDATYEYIEGKWLNDKPYMLFTALPPRAEEAECLKTVLIIASNTVTI